MTRVMTMVTKKRPNRQIPSQDLRRRITEAALRLFRERGFDAVLVQEITSAAHVAKGTFFNFFPAKRAVLATYYDQLDRYMAAELGRLDAHDPRASFSRTFRAIECHLRQEGDLARVLYREIMIDPSLGAKDAESGTSDLKQYENYLKNCQTMRSIRADINPRVAAELIQDLWISTVRRWFLAGQRFSLAKSLTRKLDILLTGLANCHSQPK